MFELNREPDPNQRLRDTFREVTGSAAHRAQQAIARGVERGWLPPGTRLAEERLADVFTVSRTPVREALFRLEAEGLVKRDIRGHVVDGLSSQQIIELYEIREALDGAAARGAASNAPRLALERLKNVNHRMRRAAHEGEHDRMAELNLEFHELVAVAAGNTMLMVLLPQIHSYVKRFRTTTFSVPDRALAAIGEHDRLIDALLAGDGDKAESVARSHMRAARDVRIQLEARVPTR